MADLRGGPDRVALLASFTSATIIAQHIAGKATRDALYLSTFPVTTLPRIMVAAAVASLVAILLTSRAMRRLGPGRLVPGAFLASGILFLLEWLLSRVAPPATAVLVYLHIGAVGALLISGFWSLVSERFDPYSAKRYLGRIAAGGTVGGILGGGLAERTAALSSLEWMLPILALLHMAAAGMTFLLRTPGSRDPVPLPGEGPRGNGMEAGEGTARMLKTLSRIPYLRNLALFVLIGTLAEGLLDYVFKAEATAALGSGDELLRLFALFYTGISVLTFLVSTMATRPVLRKLGLARTVGSYPVVTALGGVVALIFPGLGGAATARGAEAVVSNSLYRAGTEALFAPMPREEKRASKQVIDVGAVRMGDVLAAGVVQLVLALGLAAVNQTLLLVAVGLAVVGTALATRLHRGYVEALQRSLVARGGSMESDQTDRAARSAMMQTMGALGLTDLGLEISAVRRELAAESDTSRGTGPVVRGISVPVGRADETPAAQAVREDPTVTRVRALRSGEPDAVREALSRPLDGESLGHAIPLLAWDEVMPDVTRALKEVAEPHVGQLLDALLDPEQVFAVRRRIPGVLGDLASRRVFDGLAMGLEDSRFEVRYRCGRAMVRLRRRNDSLRLSGASAQQLIYREVDVDPGIWESRRILDRLDEPAGEGSRLDRVIRERVNRGLEHVFSLLALFLPPEPVEVAFRGLQTDDPFLRGTAMEYLETVLSPEVWDRLRPLVEGTGPGATGPRESRSAEEVQETLLRSSLTIVRKLEEALLEEKPEDDGDEP